ncbi:hypothetical protein ACHAPE_004037 [Trichoderma viride]
MVPKLRSKPNTRARVQRAPTKFSDLDVTPSRPGEKLHPPKNDRKDLLSSQANADDCYPDNHDVGDSFIDDTQDIKNTGPFAWVLDNFSLSARVAQMGSIRQDGLFLWDTETLWKGISSHGTLYSYLKGNEYKDLMGAWDWNLVAGTTTLLNQLKCQASQVKYYGLKDFVVCK